MSEGSKKYPIIINMKHTEESLRCLSHMQYDLFCKKNLIVRTLIAMVCILLGANNLSSWWAYPLIAYGGYLLASKYSSADHTARKIAAQLRAADGEYPTSRYEFDGQRMRIFALPENEELDPMPYNKIFELGEDREAFYIFRNQYGGYMIPKEALGEKADSLRSLLERGSGKQFINRRARFVGLKRWLSKKEDEPYRL